MKKKQTKKDQQPIELQVQDLLEEAKATVKQIREINFQAKSDFNNIKEKIDKSMERIEKIYSDLDKIEKEAGDGFDKLILQEAESLAEE